MKMALRLLRLTALLLVASVMTAGVFAADECTFVANCDYGHGDRDNAPAATKEICCSLCKARGGCAAGVLSGGDCWFKTAAEVA